MQTSRRVNAIAASQSLAMAERARQMKAAGIDVISMSLGEPDMDTPEHIRRAAQEAIDNHWSHYGPVAGIRSLREAIAETQNEQIANYPSSIVFSAEDVIVSVGAKMAIYNAIQTAINPGDEAIYRTTKRCISHRTARSLPDSPAAQLPKPLISRGYRPNRWGCSANRG